MKNILLVGSNSIHCKRYIAGLLATNEFQLTIITNLEMQEFTNIKQVVVDFSLRNLKAAKLIRQIVSQIKPDVIHIQQANSYAWHTIRALKKVSSKPKIVLTTWGSDVLVLPNTSKLMKKLVTANLVNSDIITSDSLYMSSQIAKLTHPIDKPIKTINFGIQALPEKQQLNNKQKYILSNRLHKQLYRIDKIIQAFASLVKNQLISDEYTLIVAAAGDETDKLKQLAVDLDIHNRLLFTGFIPYTELVSYYKQASIFISIPESDGTASSLLEAMAYGCIPILSNLPANLEWVIDGINGFVAADISSLTTCIISAVQLSKNKAAYNSLYDLNYRIIQEKAVFCNNLQKFIDLY